MIACKSRAALKLFIFLAALLLSVNVNAATFCKGKVITLGLGPQSGMLQINIGYGVWYLCSLKSTANGIDPSVCKAWYSMFLTAKETGSKINMAFDSTTPCTGYGSWATPSVMPYWTDIE